MSPTRTGVENLPPDFFAFFRREYGCDGVLFAELTTYRGDAPMAYAAFLGVAGDRTPTARLRIEAVETVRAALKGFDRARAS